MKNNRRRILFHARGSMTVKETQFYHKLNYEIGKMEGSLFLVGHHWPKTNELPFFRVASGLQKVQLGYIRDSFRVGEENRWDFLLNIDQLWRGDIHGRNDRMLRIRALEFFQGYYRLLLDYVQPSLVVIWNGHHPQEKILADLAKERGCRIGFVERGPIPGTIHYDCQGVLGGSSFAKQTSWEWESDEDAFYWNSLFEKIKKSLTAKPQTWWDQPKKRGRDKMIRKLKLDPERPILLFAGQVDQDVQTIYHSPNFRNCREAYIWLQKRLEKYPDWQLLGKHHPQSKTSLYNFQKITTGQAVWVKDISLEDALRLASGVVALNSTVLYEGMMRGLPALSLGKGLFSGKNIFYELTTTEPNKVIDRFLKRDSLDLRIRRFDDMMAYLLAFHFYDFTGGWEREGANGPRELAARWISDAYTDSTDVLPDSQEYLELLRFFSEKAVEPSWDFFVRGMKKKLVRKFRAIVK